MHSECVHLRKTAGQETELIKRVNDDHAPDVVTSKHGNVLIMPEDEFSAWQETIYLLRSPANAQALTESIAELESDGGQVRELIDTEDGS